MELQISQGLLLLGRPSDKQKKDFTLVLKGHINLAMAKIPAWYKRYTA